MQQLPVQSFGAEAVTHPPCWSDISPAAAEPKIKMTTHPVGDSCFRVSISVNCTACPPPLVLKTSPWKPKAVNKVPVTRAARWLRCQFSYEMLTTVISLQVSSQQAHVHKYALPHYIPPLIIHRTIKSEHHPPWWSCKISIEQSLLWQRNIAATYKVTLKEWGPFKTQKEKKAILEGLWL